VLHAVAPKSTIPAPQQVLGIHVTLATDRGDGNKH
jgi:hypothetical protein